MTETNVCDGCTTFLCEECDCLTCAQRATEECAHGVCTGSKKQGSLPRSPAPAQVDKGKEFLKENLSGCPPAPQGEPLPESVEKVTHWGQQPI